MKDTTAQQMDFDSRVRHLLEQMTIDEKIGQLCLVNYSEKRVTDEFKDALIAGRVGGIINQVNRTVVDELQDIAARESRCGIPLLVGRDVIHGFKTVFPIPLGQAATWNPELVEEAAQVAAAEAAAAGINWTYAPMLDISRDPRWGRIAESLGEDPYLTSLLGEAMIRGFQGKSLAEPRSIAACAKHFAGYGASESGKDYSATNIPPNELRNVYLPPFKSAVDAGVASIMTSFSDLDGIPASANDFLLSQVLRDEWGFDGMVVSDWDSIKQLRDHGLTSTDRESARRAANAGVDMEMSSRTFADHLKSLVQEGAVSTDRVDQMVARVLHLKFQLGLFDAPTRQSTATAPAKSSDHLGAAYRVAVESMVLLTNRNRILPLDKNRLRSIAVVGPLADDGYEQLGTWIFDGDPQLSRTPLGALRSYLGSSVQVEYAEGLHSTRTKSSEQVTGTVDLVAKSDVALLFLGEESILSGEAHCRADISLPGIQEQLISELATTGTPLVLVLMTGRPLALQQVVDDVDALLCTWHPGSMAGPAIIDLLFGAASPSGKLPVTFPRVTGQIPIYYAHRNSGRPPTAESVIHIDDIEKGAPQQSYGDTAFHMDTHFTPLFPFGHGLTYGDFRYRNIRVSNETVTPGDTVTVSVDLENAGLSDATEVVQLYIRDLAGSITRPVKELKRFQRHQLKAGEHRAVSFELSTDDLAFYNNRQQLVTEPGLFHVWVGGSSDTDLRAEFEVVAPESP